MNALSKNYNVPKATLIRHVQNRNKHAKSGAEKFGRSTDLPEEVEREIVRHVLELERCLFGINSNDLRKLAYDVAETNEISVSKMGKLTKKCYYAFLSRHKELSLRQPEATLAARALGFSKKKVIFLDYFLFGDSGRIDYNRLQQQLLHRTRCKYTFDHHDFRRLTSVIFSLYSSECRRRRLVFNDKVGMPFASSQTASSDPL